MRFLGGFLTCLVLLIVAALVVVYGGWYNVAATEPHSAPVRWLFTTAMHNSVSKRADGIDPPALTDEMARAGAGHFESMCVPCHGAPGVERGEMGKGLRPAAPPLSRAAEQLTSAETFWVIKNGIKFTGMPAWGETHDDSEIWALVAFVERLPEMSPAEYETMSRSSAHGDEDAEAGGHSHDG